jgi:fructokinase
MSALLGGIEAGGTKFVCVAAREGPEILAEIRIPTTTPGATLDAALEFFASATAKLGALSAVGIAAFGPVDIRPSSPSFGRILATPKPDWAGTDLVAPFARRFGCPVAIDTDVNAAALAETLLGAGRGCGTVVYVTVGTGVGGGIVVDGRTLKGYLHPEMGHIRVVRHERDAAFPGVCPFHGDCVEGLASGPAIEARYGAPLDRLPPGHEASRVVAHYLGQLAANVMLTLSPERVVFGGGVMSCEPLLREIRAAAAKALNGYAGLGSDAASLESLIVAPGLGARSGIVGALALASAALPSASHAAGISGAGVSRSHARNKT